MTLLPRLTDGLSHIVIVTDEDGHVQGVVSQTDLLATVAQSLAHRTGSQTDAKGLMPGSADRQSPQLR